MNDTSNCETSALQALSDCMIDALSYDMECISDALLSDLRRLADKRPDYVGLCSLIDSHEPSLRTHLHHENVDEFVESLETLLWRSIPERLRSNAAFSDRLDLLIDRAATAFSKVDHFQLTDDLHDIVNHCLTDGVDDRKLPVVITDSTIRIGRHTTVSFVRTLRIPEDGKTYQLPAGFGKLPIYRVEDYTSTVPPKWLEDGGFFIPLYQREALYLEFGGVNWRPSILKVAVGHVNAITGKPFDKQIREHSQDYVVAPDQQWLDGINKGNGTVGQFVAMPLGEGYTVEEQVTDEAKHGGFQMMAYDSKDSRFPNESPNARKEKESDYWKRHPKPIELPAHPLLPATSKETEFYEEKDTLAAPPTPEWESHGTLGSAKKRIASKDFSGSQALYSAPKRSAKFEPVQAMSAPAMPQVVEMGIAAGGAIEQKVVLDKYGADSWDENTATPICIHMVNSEAFEAITGQKPPETPITAYSYKKRGIPWYSNYDESVPGLPGAKAFQFIKSILQIDKKRGIKDAHTGSTLSIRPEQVQSIHVPTMVERIKELRAAIRTSFEGQRFDACVRECTWLLDLAPRDPNALLARAKCYLEMGENYTADLDATDILETQPENVEAYLVRAEANLNSGWVANAINDAAAAVKLAPTHPKAQELFRVAMKSRPR
jgi:hypothetical protein